MKFCVHKIGLWGFSCIAIISPVTCDIFCLNRYDLKVGIRMLLFNYELSIPTKKDFSFS